MKKPQFLSLTFSIVCHVGGQQVKKAMMKIMRDPAIKDKLIKLGYEPIGSNGSDLAAAQKANLARWEKPIKATGTQLE